MNKTLLVTGAELPKEIVEKLNLEQGNVDILGAWCYKVKGEEIYLFNYSCSDTKMVVFENIILSWVERIYENKDGHISCTGKLIHEMACTLEFLNTIKKLDKEVFINAERTQKLKDI